MKKNKENASFDNGQRSSADKDKRSAEDKLSTEELRRKLQDKKQKAQQEAAAQNNLPDDDDFPDIDETLDFKKAENPLADMNVKDLMKKFLPEEDVKYADPERDLPAAVLEEDPAAAYDPAPQEELPGAVEEIVIEKPLASEKPVEELPESALEDAEHPVEADSAPLEPLSDSEMKEMIQLTQKQSEEALPEEELASDTDSMETDSMEMNAMEKPKKKKKPFFFGRRKKEAEENAEESPVDQAAFEEGVKAKDAELDETDVKLMMAFGMEDELANTVGFDKVSAVEEGINEERKTVDAEQKKNSAEADFTEFTDVSQVKGIFAAYKRQYQQLLLKMLGAIFLMIFAFFFENIDVFGGSLPDGWNGAYYPIVHGMLEIQMLVLGCALIWRSLYSGWKKLLAGCPNGESVVLLLMAVSAVYDLTHCFINGAARFYSFPLTVAVFLVMLYEMFALRREISSFNIAASKRDKYTLVRLEGEEEEQEKEAFHGALPSSQALFRISRSRFVDGFFAKMRGTQKPSLLSVVMIAAMFGTALLIGIIGLFTSKSVGTALNSAYVAMLFAAPLSMLIAGSYPFFAASRHAFRVGGAIIGEEALEEYSKGGAISFEDKDVFPESGVKIKSVKVYGSNRIDNIIYYAASLFMQTGGPVAPSFEVATRDIGHSEQVEILHVESSGIEAIVDERHIYIGKAEYLADQGYRMALEEDDDDGSGEISVMYMAIDDELAAKMYIRYAVDPEFQAILAQLSKTGMCVGVKTFDPNIDDEMLSARIQVRGLPVKVIKYSGTEDLSQVYEHQSSGIISKNSAKSLLQTLSLCEKVNSAIKNNAAVRIAALSMSLVLCVILLMLGVAAKVPSMYVALYQLFWIIPIVLIAKVCIGK